MKADRKIDGLDKAIESNKDFAAGSFTASEMILFGSDLKPTGPVYTALAKFKLGGSMMFGYSNGMWGGSYTGTGDTGTFIMGLSPMWNRPASLAEVAGVYTRTVSYGYAMTMTIDANGQFSASDTRGCLINGRGGPGRDAQPLPAGRNGLVLRRPEWHVQRHGIPCWMPTPCATG